MKSSVYIRTDGNKEIGLGHVIRCLALAEMLNTDFDCILVTRFLTSYIEAEANRVCKRIINLPETDEHFGVFLSLLNHNDIVVLDNYFFSSEYQLTIKSKGCKLVCIDDIHKHDFICDVIINHAGGLNRKLYKNIAYSALYTGTEYSLLRQPFLSRKKNHEDGILISMGGTDKNNEVLQILKSIEKKKTKKKCFTIIGDAYCYLDELEIYSKESNLNLQIHKNLTAEQLAAIMIQCNTIICPPSSVSYEFQSLVGGNMFLKMIADNQKDIYNFFIDTKLAYDYKDFFIDDRIKNKKKPVLSQSFFDGQSPLRLKKIFNGLNQEKKLFLRNATLTDTDLLFRWVNDPETRLNAINQKKIKYDEHCVWFGKKLISKDSYLWILELEDQPVGQIRFDLENNDAFLSYSIDINQRGKGLGLSILRLGIYKLLNIKNNFRIKAIVRKNNLTSCFLFDRLNFIKKNIADDYYLFYK